MGNVHEVIQTEPWRSPHGAAILVREGKELVNENFPSYTNLHSGDRAIGRKSFFTNRLWLVVQTGGKWGYGDELEAFIAANADVLEDARFYVSDEYSQYVQEWRLKNGSLAVEIVAPDNSHTGLYLLASRPQHREFALSLLDDLLDGTLFFSEPDPTSVRSRAVRALVEHAPERWQTWLHLGNLKIDSAEHMAAVTALEHALELAPPNEIEKVEVRLLRALAEVDRSRALALGRERSAAWITAAERHAGYFNPIAAGIDRLADLERDHGAPDLAVPLAMHAMRVGDTDALPQRLYNIACLRSLERRPDEARDWLRAAILIDPSLTAQAANDPDLAPLGDLTRLCDPTRDPEVP